MAPLLFVRWIERRDSESHTPTFPEGNLHARARQTDRTRVSLCHLYDEASSLRVYLLDVIINCEITLNIIFLGYLLLRDLPTIF